MIKKYFYNINYAENECDICRMELKYLFGEDIKKKNILSHVNVKMGRSPFLKEKIEIIIRKNSLREIIDEISETNLICEAYKVVYVKHDGQTVQYGDRIEAVKAVGTAITGKAEMHNPKIVYGITQIDDKWIFGKYERDDCKWHSHDKKLHSYSNAIGLRLSRALINIAVGNDLSLTIIDPCCGVGTVIIDGLSMGINIKGFEKNKQIARNAKENLSHFGYENVITTSDMRTIKERFDVAIVDLPYGVFTPITEKEQEEIIETTRKIAEKVIFVTFDNMDEIIEEAGFQIVDKCSISKGNFTRWINICE